LFNERRNMRLWTYAAFEFVLLSVLAVVRANLWTYGADTGTFVQIIENTWHGMYDGFEQSSHFSYHWSPSLASLWPLLALTHSAIVLQIVQAFATVATAPLTYLLARSYVSERLAMRVGIVALLYPPLMAVGFDEFHELGFFPPLVLALAVTADRGMWWWFALCALFGVGLREDVALELVIFGIVLLAIGLRPAREGRGLLDGAPRNPRKLAAAGGALAISATASLALYFGVILPHVGSWKPEHFYDYAFAKGPLALVAAVFYHPFEVAAATLTTGRFTYTLEAFVPLALLPAGSAWMLLAIPGAMIVLLANSADVWRMGTHYAALWIPWLLIASVGAVAAIERRRGETAALRWTTVAIAACILFLIAFDPMHPLHYLHSAYADRTSARSALACVPNDATISTHDEWFSAIAATHPNATANHVGDTQYLVYASDYPNQYYQEQVRPRVEHALADGQYRAVCHFGNVTAYERVR
jgi:uncharacterized membrane protein